MADASENRTLSIVAHVLGLFVGFLGPLIVYLVTKEEPARTHARNALNWQISLIIYMIISVILIIILVGLLLIGILALLNIIFSIVAAVKASNGEIWKYPLAIEFLK